MSKIRIKFDESLNRLSGLLLDSKDIGFETVDENPDLLVTKDIPKESKYFVVIVWEKHEIDKIEKFDHNRYKNLRGFFIKNEIERNLTPFLETLNDVKQEILFIRNLKCNAEQIKNNKESIKIGSLVEIKNKADRKQLEDIFGKPRFTSLFIDRPMLKMMSKLSRILDDMALSIHALDNYKGIIGKIIKNSGLKNKKFDISLLKDLHRQRKRVPIKFNPILLTGDTGVGKTLIARWIHGEAGGRISGIKFPGTFQEINSSGLNPNLLESVLFGYVEGTFTGAKQDKPGKALLAIGGVLFLDEIGDMPPEIQPRVMKFIEEMTFTPEGWYSVEQFYTPLLIVAATNKNLEEEVKKGDDSKFRRDLYARFRYRIHVPSIEERKGSLDAIVDFILQNPKVNGEGQIKYISKTALKRLQTLKYEENFRGLERVIREAAFKTIDYGMDIIMPEVIEG